MSNLIRLEIVDAARAYLGTPWHHQGRLKGVGVDCIGLILGVAKDIKLGDFDKPKFRQYGRRPPRGPGMMAEFDEVCQRTDNPRIGDILVFWINPRNKRPQHCGIMTDIGVIHTFSEIGKVVEHRLDEKWKGRILQAYNYPGVD
jgi:cell wall-associated NlpC family hydrolase